MNKNINTSSDGTTENENNSQTYSATFINTVQQIWIILLTTISRLSFFLSFNRFSVALVLGVAPPEYIKPEIGERECSVLIKILMKSWGSLIPADKHPIKLHIERKCHVLFNPSLFVLSGCFLPWQSVSQSVYKTVKVWILVQIQTSSMI